MESNKPAVGLLGFGSFGRLLVREVQAFASLVVHDPFVEDAEIESAGARAGTFQQVCGQSIVVFCIPVQMLENMFKQAAPLLKPGTLVLDVASVKQLPMLWMQHHLPADVEYIGTHPLFGPQSGKHGVAGLNMVVCQGRSSQYHNVVWFLKHKLGLHVLERSPENHDKQMAYVQGLTHLIGRVVNEMDIPDVEQKTPAYQFMLDIKRNLGQDSWDLFLAIEQLNPYARAVRDDFERELLKMNQLLRES